MARSDSHASTDAGRRSNDCYNTHTHTHTRSHSLVSIYTSRQHLYIVSFWAGSFILFSFLLSKKQNQKKSNHLGVLLCLYIIYIRADAAILCYYITSCRGDYVYIRMSYTYISLYFVYIIHQKVKYARLFLVVDFFFMKFIFFFFYFFFKRKYFLFFVGVPGSFFD